MAKRGRPKHPDILTPREWEVLALLREGLTNDQIAGRLNITERTAKYHVAEILGKLGVSSRQEAAAWDPDAGERRWWQRALVPGALLWRKLHLGWLAPAAAGVTAVAVAAGAGLLVWGLVRTQGDGDGASAALAPTATREPAPAALDVSARDPQEYVLIYTRALFPGGPGRTFVRTLDAAGESRGDDIEIGVDFRASLAPARSPAFDATPLLLAEGPLDQRDLFHLRADGPVHLDQSLAGRCAVAGNGRDLIYCGEGDSIIARDTQGRIAAEYAYPKPVPLSPDDPITRTTAVFAQGSRSVSVVVPTPDGHILAFVEGISNSLVVDLTTGEQLDMLGYGRVVTATLAENGFVYAVIGGYASPLEIVKIDPLAVRIVAQEAVSGGPFLLDAVLLPAPDGDVYVYLGTQSLFYRLDRDTAAAAPISIPPGLGLHAAVGVDGMIYFYGGFGENRVSVYDPATGELEEDVPWLRAPGGTYVHGVVAR